MTRDDYIDLYLSEMDLGPQWRVRQKTGVWAPGEAEIGQLNNVSDVRELRDVAERASVAPIAPIATVAAVAKIAPIATVSHLPPTSKSVSMPAATRPNALTQKCLPVGELQTLGWDALEVSMRACSACGLCRQRRQAVPGVGDRPAEWLFIGEGPGEDEDAQGEPFVGPTGKLLDNMLLAIGLRRGENVYIANSVKCRPPNNRAPEAAEIDTCKPYLDRQIALLQPKLIVLLGRAAARSVLGSEDALASLRGRLHKYGEIPVVVTYHPAYLLRTLHDKAKAWEDLCLARQTMRRLDSV